MGGAAAGIGAAGAWEAGAFAFGCGPAATTGAGLVEGSCAVTGVDGGLGADGDTTTDVCGAGAAVCGLAGGVAGCCAAACFTGACTTGACDVGWGDGLTDVVATAGTGCGDGDAGRASVLAGLLACGAGWLGGAGDAVVGVLAGAGVLNCGGGDAAAAGEAGADATGAKDCTGGVAIC